MIHRIKRPTKTHIAVISLMTVAIFGFVSRSVFSNTVSNAQNIVESTSSVASETLMKSPGLPLRLIIPSLSINALVEQVSLTADGAMDVPKDPMNVGWYAPGVRPGAVGSAVIDGHVDWLQGATAVFADLDNVKIGDRINTEDDTGSVASFIVRDIRTLDATADATSVFTSDDGKVHLNLITCSGSWNKRAQQYEKRLVIFADKE